MTTYDQIGESSGMELAAPERFGPWRRPDVFRVVSLAGIAVSALLLVEGSFSEPRLCGFDSACHEVIHSRFSKPLGIPLSAVGVSGFGVLFALSLAPGTRIGRWLLPLSLMSAAAGVFLVGVQVFVIGHLCPFCLLVDALAVFAGCLAATGRRGEVDPEIGSGVRALWASAAVVLPSALALVSVAPGAGGEGIGKEVPVPPRISATWVPDKVTLVEIYDFECPHCRRLEPILVKFLAEEGDRVHHVRLTVPMPSHRHARPASRAFLCAERQGKGVEMASRLIVSPGLTPSACEDAASEIGLSLPEYRSCVADPATDGRIDADLAWVKEAHPAGLPVIWVQDRPLLGLRPDRALDTLRAAVRAARERMGLLP